MKEVPTLCYNLLNGCPWHLRGACHFEHKKISSEEYRTYLLQQITKVTSIFQRKMQILQATLTHLQMEDQRKVAEQTSKAPNHAKKKKKKKTPLRKKKKKKTQEDQSASSSYETASEEEEEEEWIPKDPSLRKHAGPEDKATATAAASEFQKNIAAMRKMVLMPYTNSGFDHQDRNELGCRTLSRAKLPDRPVFRVQGINDPVSGQARTSAGDLGATSKSRMNIRRSKKNNQ